MLITTSALAYLSKASQRLIIKETYSTFVSGVGSGSGSLSNGLFFKSSSFEEFMFHTSRIGTDFPQLRHVCSREFEPLNSSFCGFISWRCARSTATFDNIWNLVTESVFIGRLGNFLSLLNPCIVRIHIEKFIHNA